MTAGQSFAGRFVYLQRFTLHDVLGAMMQLEGRQGRQQNAVETITRRYRTLDLRCGELLQLLYRTIRDLSSPLADISA